MDYKAVVDFWFEEIEAKRHYKKDAAFDQLIKDRFEAVHSAAARGELYRWRKDPEGRLAEIVVLDQFSRNIYRDTPLSFAYDAMALILAQEAVSQNIDKKLSTSKKAFLYMPYMHSESLLIHESAIKLFSLPGLESSLEWEIKHKKIIEAFGRYPHRNGIIGRESTSEELEFLKKQGSSF